MLILVKRLLILSNRRHFSLKVAPQNLSPCLPVSLSQTRPVCLTDCCNLIKEACGSSWGLYFLLLALPHSLSLSHTHIHAHI